MYLDLIQNDYYLIKPIETYVIYYVYLLNIEILNIRWSGTALPVTN